MVELIRQCLHCMDSVAGTIRPRSLRAVVHGAGVGEAIIFRLLHVEAAAPLDLGQAGMGAKALIYVLFIVEGIRDYVWLGLTAMCRAAITADTLLCW